MNTSLPRSKVPQFVSPFLLILLLLTLVGCTPTVVYTHTTSVKASAKELDVQVLGVLPEIHVTDGSVEVSITTVISLSTGLK